MSDISQPVQSEHNRHRIPKYSTSIWEILGVGAGALALVVVAVIGVANQLMLKMQDAEQAESLSRRAFDYTLPGGARGLMSLSIGAETFALVGSRQPSVSDAMVLITQTPIENNTDDPRNFAEELSLKQTLIGDWQSVQTTHQTVEFCGQKTDIEIQQGSFQLVMPAVVAPPVINLVPSRTVPAITYNWEYTHKQVRHQIQLLATGQAAEGKIKPIFKSFKCRQN
jgi:hypothetical protein